MTSIPRKNLKSSFYSKFLNYFRSHSLLKPSTGAVLSRLMPVARKIKFSQGVGLITRTSTTKSCRSFLFGTKSCRLGYKINLVVQL